MSDDGWGNDPKVSNAPSNGFCGISFAATNCQLPASQQPSGAPTSFANALGFGSMNNQSPSAPFGNQTNSNGFGSGFNNQTTASSTFGKPQNNGFGSATNNQANSGSTFGNPNNQAIVSSSFGNPMNSSLFASNNKSATSTSPIGNQTSNGFGSATNNQANPGSTFGNSTGGVGFGGAPNNQSTGISGFGKPTISGGFNSAKNSQAAGSSPFVGSAGFGSFSNNQVGGFGSNQSTFDIPGGFGSSFNTDPSKGKSDNACRRCGETGHFAKDCSQPPRPSGACNTCGEEGHFSRDCTKQRPPSSDPCKFCNEVGHWNRDCPKARCSNCRQEEHVIAACPNPCNRYNQLGHQPRDCSKPPTCRNCGNERHMSAECQDPPKPREDGQKPPSTFVREDEDVEELLKTALHGGSMFDRFFAAESDITGGVKPGVAKIESFDQLGLDSRILQNINCCGYLKPTPVQQLSMPIIKSGSDLIACSQTGSGKTAAYLIPTMNDCHLKKDYGEGEENCHPRILVIVPTRELAVQVFNESRKYGYLTPMRSIAVYGGTSVQAQRTQLKLGQTVVAATLGRLKQFVEEGIIVLDMLRFIVFDEVDRLIEQDTENIMQSISAKSPNDVQRIMFSATLPAEVQTQAKAILKQDFVFLTVDKVGAANSCITQEFIYLDWNKKEEELMKLLDIDTTNLVVQSDTKIFEKKTLIFVGKKSFVDVLAATICQAGIPATSIHADRLQNERNEALKDFVYGRKAVLVASAILERGLDIKGVDLVINYDMPVDGAAAPAIDQYVHRIGRTGRVGNPGRAVSFITERDLKMTPALVALLKDSGQVVPDWIAQAAKGEDMTVPFAPAATEEGEW